MNEKTNPIFPQDTLRVGSTVEGEIALENEIDYFSVNLKSGSHYIFEMLGWFQFDGLTLADPLLQLFDSKENLVAFNDNGGFALNSRLDVTIDYTGTYRLAASASSGTGTYRLAIHDTNGSDDYGQTSTTAGVLLGQRTSGIIDYAGDIDWFSINLEKGNEYNFSLREIDASHPLRQPQLYLYDSMGGLISSDLTGDVSGRVTFTAQESGKYYLGATASTSSTPYQILDEGLSTSSEVVPLGPIIRHFDEVTSPKLASESFGTLPNAGGWASNNAYPRQLGDVNGDGRADIVGFGAAGAYVALATSDGHFETPFLASTDFGAANSAGGWASNNAYPRQLGDVNGDGRADIVGFGAAGAYVALATSDGHFETPFLASTDFGAANSAGGWASNNAYPRQLGDVNGDGRADIVGFGAAGAYVALATSDGHFGTPFLASTDFGAANSAGGWESADLYPRQLGDVNGDGRVDIVGFGAAGAYVALATSDGHFGTPFLASTDFGAANSAGGWASNNAYPRQLDDVNGDGRADIVGFGAAGAYVALATSDGHFGTPFLASTDFGAANSAGGWESADLYPRQLGDVNGDGRVDIVGFGAAGAYVASAWDVL